MKLIRAALFIAALALPAAARAEDSAPCREAAAQLDAFLAAQPHDCKADEDCDGYFFRAASCTAAVVLAKAGVTEDFTEELLEKQKEVRAACAAEWGIRPVCSPMPFRAVCRDGMCADAVSAPSPAPEQDKKP